MDGEMTADTTSNTADRTWNESDVRQCAVNVTVYASELPSWVVGYVLSLLLVKGVVAGVASATVTDVRKTNVSRGRTIKLCRILECGPGGVATVHVG